MLRKIAPALIALMLMAGCTTDGIGPKQGFGTLGGAAAGGLLGSQIGGGTGKLAATAAGTLLGAFLGSEIGSSLDRADQLALERSTVEALDTKKVGKRVTWSNPETGRRGNVRTIRETHSNGAYCREY